MKRLLPVMLSLAGMTYAATVPNPALKGVQLCLPATGAIVTSRTLPAGFAQRLDKALRQEIESRNLTKDIICTAGKQPIGKINIYVVVTEPESDQHRAVSTLLEVHDTNLVRNATVSRYADHGMWLTNEVGERLWMQVEGSVRSHFHDLMVEWFRANP
ncbi:hypothetical protein [Deinococcus hohokamensis]|uniref:Uncharacterized protein n=1 Tax=Deinococcus hohokamensis TaxID=309883 RepID=A0ABV9IBT9_9DEIO